MKGRFLSLPIALTVGVLAAAAARAQSADDRTLLSAFCDAANIQGSACKRAKKYPEAGRRGCDVKLTGSRYTGKFLVDGETILIATYASDCEPHANDYGGSVLFELAGERWTFRGFQPGYQASDCVTLPKNARQDDLICLTGHMGQGHLETGVARMVFARNSSKAIELSFDFLMNAEDSIGAYGANTVNCKEPPVYFGLSNLRAGSRPETVSVDAAYADEETISTACGKGFPPPKEVFGELGADEAYVPEGNEKNGKFTIDLVTRKIARGD